jgi:hypothetical protein
LRGADVVVLSLSSREAEEEQPVFYDRPGDPSAELVANQLVLCDPRLVEEAVDARRRCGEIQ